MLGVCINRAAPLDRDLTDRKREEDIGGGVAAAAAVSKPWRICDLGEEAHTHLILHPVAARELLGCRVLIGRD